LDTYKLRISFRNQNSKSHQTIQRTTQQLNKKPPNNSNSFHKKIKLQHAITKHTEILTIKYITPKYIKGNIHFTFEFTFLLGLRINDTKS